MNTNDLERLGKVRYDKTSIIIFRICQKCMKIIRGNRKKSGLKKDWKTRTLKTSLKKSPKSVISEKGYPSYVATKR